MRWTADTRQVYEESTTTSIGPIIPSQERVIQRTPANRHRRLLTHPGSVVVPDGVDVPQNLEHHRRRLLAHGPKWVRTGAIALRGLLAKVPVTVADKATTADTVMTVMEGERGIAIQRRLVAVLRHLTVASRGIGRENQ